jgi:hypothetical protein
MIAWEWTRQTVAPDDILDAARSIPASSHRHLMTLFTEWTDADTYLDWAKAALNRTGDDCWDSAAGWAKRGVCRRMDGILAHNHLGCFLSKNYKVKSDYLAKLKVPGLNILRHTVIDPRNGFEHEYALATEEQARQAVEVAELFLLATEGDSYITAVVDLGWHFEFSDLYAADRDPRHVIKISLTKEHSPMLVVNGYPDNPHVLVLYPRDELLSVCPLSCFASEQVLALNTILREPFHKSGGHSWSSITPAFMAAMKEQLKL